MNTHTDSVLLDNDGKPEKTQRLSEDWTAAFVGLAILAVGFVVAWFAKPTELNWSTKENAGQEIKWSSPLKGSIGTLNGWVANPADAFREAVKKTDGQDKQVAVPRKWIANSIIGAFLASLIVGVVAVSLRGLAVGGFLAAFPIVFSMAVLAYVLAGQEVVNKYSLEYALWALLVGLIIANTIGTPTWLRPAVLGELYIKIGLVLLGAEVLFGRLLELGLPGVMVSWVVTPIVFVTTYLFGQYILKISSRSLNLVISADMSVCGVSAAIATGAACKAKKEELSLAIGLSLAFTVIMMVVLPAVILWSGMDPVVGGAWIGGTIDATGAVAAAGEALGKVGSETAVTIKMIQNILIGVIAFAVAVYWTRWVEPKESPQAGSASNIGIGEIWKRFPKFVIGFLAASIVCSILFAASYFGELWVNASVSSLSKPLRGWLFCLAFVSIGLDTNFRQLAPYLKSGKPAVLYLCGQALNLILTLAMAYLMFGVLFKK